MILHRLTPKSCLKPGLVGPNVGPKKKNGPDPRSTEPVVFFCYWQLTIAESRRVRCQPRRIPAAKSALRRPQSATSYASRRTPPRRRLFNLADSGPLVPQMFDSEIGLLKRASCSTALRVRAISESAPGYQRLCFGSVPRKNVQADIGWASVTRFRTGRRYSELDDSIIRNRSAKD